MADEVQAEEVTEETTETNADADTSENTEVNEETPVVEEDKSSEEIDWKAKYEKERAESTKWEKRSKGNLAEVTGLKTQVAEYEAQVAESADLRDQLTVKTTEAAKFKAALEHGLSIEDTTFLTGSTEEEISEAAKKFAARVGAGTNRISLRTQGGSTTSARPMTYQESLAEQIRAAEQARASK